MSRRTEQPKLPLRFASATVSAGAAAEGEPPRMRAPCRSCGATAKRIEWNRNGQDVVRCSTCDAYAYCAPRSETGRPQRTVQTRLDLRPRQRARIFSRDLARCVLCTADRSTRIDVGHLLSVKDGRALGVSHDWLAADDNLAVMCAECNDWLGANSLAPVLIARVLRAREMRGTDPTAP